MKNNIFIPNKIKVGFQQRDDTYTKTLALGYSFDEAMEATNTWNWLNVEKNETY